MENIYVIGAGCMGRAILFGLRRTLGLAHLRVIETDSVQSEYLAVSGFHVKKSIDTIDYDDIVILAVPPDQFQKSVENNPALLTHCGPVISVMAGVTIDLLSKILRHARLVRSIPNTPSEVQEGMTLYYVRDETDAQLISISQSIFGSIGQCAQVADENQIDSATAFAGGGPALVAYFANALQIYAEHQGFDSEAARAMTIQLLYGTALLMRATGKTSMQLCREVQTPSGTTERAIQLLDSHNLNKSIFAALAAAAERSAELGRSLHERHDYDYGTARPDEGSSR